MSILTLFFNIRQVIHLICIKISLVLSISSNFSAKYFVLMTMQLYFSYAIFSKQNLTVLGQIWSFGSKPSSKDLGLQLAPSDIQTFLRHWNCCSLNSARSKFVTVLLLHIFRWYQFYQLKQLFFITPSFLTDLKKTWLVTKWLTIIWYDFIWALERELFKEGANFKKECLVMSAEVERENIF